MIGLIQQIQRRTPLGWLQLNYEKSRLAVAISGIAFADILMFMQLGFLTALYDTNTLFHRSLKTDLVIISSEARELANMGTFSRRRLYQAMDVPGVKSAEALYINNIEWQNPQTRRKTELLVAGVNPDHPVFNLPEVNQKLDQIKLPDTLLLDRASRGEYQQVVAQINQGQTVMTEIERRTVTVAGLFEIGSSFTSDGTLITSDQNFLRLFPKREAGAVTLGLIELQSGYDPQQVAAVLNATLPKDIRVLTYRGFVQFQEDWITENQPISFVFGLGTLMGFIVGVVIVYQILSTDVNDHKAEYATFKAMGYRNRYLLGVVFEEAVILAVLGFVPGVSVALGLYHITRNATALPLAMPLMRVVLVLVLTIFMCALSGAIATRKLQSADPADIF